jgi:flagellar assembly protein FliH
MSSSSDAAVRGDAAPGYVPVVHPVASPAPARLPDLRSGHWTRLGDDGVLGDEVTEQALGALAERTRDAARAQGYAVGWAEGRREALDLAARESREASARAAESERRREEAHRRAVASLAGAADALLDAVDGVCAHVADQATDLALEVTRAIVGRELALATDPGADAVRRVLAALPEAPVARVRLPVELTGSPALAELAEQGLAVTGDPSLALGDAVVETDEAAVDLRVGTALERLAEVLR